MKNGKKNLQLKLQGLQKNSNQSNFNININKFSQKELENSVIEALKFNDKSKIDRNILIKLIDKIVIENKKIKSITYNFSIAK
ncbi:MAG: hypothetical protein IKD77_04815 [Bacilli bacterium]|nr:hypothetical protein [Bacilli bacterium]